MQSKVLMAIIAVVLQTCIGQFSFAINVDKDPKGGFIEWRNLKPGLTLNGDAVIVNFKVNSDGSRKLRFIDRYGTTQDVVITAGDYRFNQPHQDQAPNPQEFSLMLGDQTTLLETINETSPVAVNYDRAIVGYRLLNADKNGNETSSLLKKERLKH